MTGTRHDPSLEEVDSALASMAELIQSPLPIGQLPGAVELAISSSPRLSALERLDIYREQFWLRHVDSLTEDFPATSGLFGEAWPRIATRYLTAHPPSSPSLRELGFRLPEYLATLQSAELPPLALDMARLECAYLEVFDAPDEAPFTLDAALGLRPDQWLGARLRLSGAIRLLELAHPVADFRRALRAGEDAEPFGKPRSVHLVVYRRDLGLWDRELGPQAFHLLQRLARGVPLGEACAESAALAPESEPLFDAQLGEWFATWTRLGWISGVDIS